MSVNSKAVAAETAKTATAPTDLSAIVPLLWEIANLKRIKPAHLNSSFAENLFARAWAKIAAGFNVRQVAVQTTANALAAAQLGAIDRHVLRLAKLSEIEVQTIFERSFDLSAASIENLLREELRSVLVEDFAASGDAVVPQFVAQLARQPRSGATKPGAPKLVFDQPENHAEHCVSVAIFAVLLAPHFEADLETAFLAGLAHHFHNAYLPDSGFAGEELLGEFLPVIFNNFREQCLRELPENLKPRIREIFHDIETADKAESKAFHAADVFDRVLQMRHHAEANEFTLKYALEDMELVHVGAVQQFHYDILREAKLI